MFKRPRCFRLIEISSQNIWMSGKKGEEKKQQNEALTGAWFVDVCSFNWVAYIPGPSNNKWCLKPNGLLAWHPWKYQPFGRKAKGYQGFLVGGFNPIEKYDRQIGNLPQIGVKIKNIWNHHLGLYLCLPHHFLDPNISNIAPRQCMQSNMEVHDLTFHRCTFVSNRIQ